MTTNTTDPDYPQYPTYYGTVINNPLWQKWGEVAHTAGFDWHESVECGWLSPEHFSAFLVFVIETNEDSLENLIFKAQPDLREITFHSDGRVIAKTGARAKFPKKLYTAYPPKDTLTTFGELAKKAVKKLLDELNAT